MQTKSYEAIHKKFIEQEKDYRVGPSEFRRCKDICCLLTFFILLFAFTAIGIYYLVVASDALRNHKIKIVSNPLSVIQELFVKYWPIILGMFGLSFLLSIIFMCFLRYCTKCMVYSIIVTSILILGGIIGISIASRSWGTLIAAAIALLFFLIILCCYWKAIKTGIVLLQSTMQFLRDRPKIYFIPFLVLLLLILFLTFWIITFVCMQYQASLETQTKLNYAKQIVFYVFYIFMLFFMTAFLYYVMVFLIGYTCAKWFYNHISTGCCRGFSLLNSAHIGSLTFASLLIGILKILQLLGSTVYRGQNATGNSCAACCMCWFSCCLGAVQWIIQLLNKNAVIVMALTGESFLDSAKTAASIIFKNFPLFYIATAMGELLKYAGVFFAAGVPTLVGYLLLHTVYANKVANSYQVTNFILLIFFVCLVISIFFTTLISISLSAVFIYYCLDLRYREIGVTLPNTPLSFRKLNNSLYLPNHHQEPMVPYSADRIL